MKRLSWILSLLLVLSAVAIPSTALAKSSIDIVFIIDRSGSMDSSFAAVKNNVNDFANKLAARGVSYRLGLVVYEQAVQKYDLTSNVEAFKNQVGSIWTDGGVENGLDAIMEAAQTYPFDVNAKKYFILIGDEVVTSDLGYSIPSTIDYLRNMQITLTTIGISDIRYQFEQLSSQTGGMYLDLNSNFSTSLTSIFDQIQQMPTLEVLSPTSGQMLSDLNTGFIPTVKVTDPDSDTLQLAYYVDSEASPRDVKTITNSKNPQTVSFNALNIGILTEGDHVLRFTAYDGSDTASDSATIRVDKAKPVLGTVGVTSTATTVQISGSAWDAMSGLDSSAYRYTVGTNVSPWTATPTNTISNLTPGMAYRVVFEARDAVGHIAAYETTIHTKAQTPVIVKNQVSESTAVLGFQDSNASTTSYQIKSGNQYISASGQLTSTASWITASNKSFTVNGLASNTDYSFQAKARNLIGEETGYSNVLNVRTWANPPTDITLNSKQTWVLVSWPAVSGATRYDVEADGTVTNTGTSNSFTHSGLSPNTQHRYRVRVTNAGGTGNWSQTATVFTLPDPPAAPVNVNTVPTQTEVKVTWDSVARADSYDIQVDGRVTAVGSGTQFIQGGLLPETSHTFQVRAKNAGGISEWSPSVAVDTLPYPPAAPVGLTSEATNNQVAIKWPSVAGATSYEVEADGLIIANENRTSYTDTGLFQLTYHTYRVRAVNAGGKSAWSVPLNIRTLPDKPTKPTNIMTTADLTSITVMWYHVENFETYEVEIDGKQIETVSNNQFVHNNLLSGSSHSYRIRAHNVSGYSEWTKPTVMKTFVQGEANRSLTNMAAIVTNHSITITWDTVAQDAKYEIEVDGRISDLGSDTVFQHGGLAAEENHVYRIRLKSDAGAGTWVAVLSLSTLPDLPGAPSVLKGNPADYSIELHWDRVEGATGYDLEIDGKTVDTGSADSFTHKDLEPGTAHTYRLRAKNQTGVTAWSLALNTSTTSPSYVIDAHKNQPFDLSLLAFNVQDFSELTFVVRYDPNQVEVSDLYQFTPVADVMLSGAIPNSDAEVDYSKGQIKYTFKRNVVPGTSWSGELCTLTFKSKVDGKVAIEVFVE